MLSSPKARAALDERNANSKCGEHTTVLDADNATADDNHRLGQVGEVEHQIGINDGGPVDGNLCGSGGLGAGADEDVLRLVDR